MAVASVKRDVQRSSQHQKQFVNVTVNPQTTVTYPAPYEIDEGITVVPSSLNSLGTSSVPSPSVSPQPQQQTRDIPGSKSLDELQTLVKNNETAVKALIMIIDILQSNPLIINKLIVAYADAFKELVKVLTSADDVDIQYVDEVSCFTSSKYKLVEDVFVIIDSESISLKYGFPDVMRLFDRFKISTKMIAC